MNNDLISRSALKDALSEAHINRTLTFDIATFCCVMKIIDLAPTVEPTENSAIQYSLGYQDGFLEGKKMNERTQGEWFEYISKGLLKSRHGDYVLYKIDYLLDNLAREIYLLEGARRVKGGSE